MATQNFHYQQPDFNLLDAFQVTEEELILNRSGKLSPAQKKRIWRDRLPSILLFALGWLLAAVAYTGFRIQSADSTLMQILSLAMVLSLLAAIVVFSRAWRKMYELRVEALIGTINIEQLEGRTGGMYLAIDGRRFPLKPPQCAVLNEETPLAVYFVEPRKRVLSVEKIVFRNQTD